MWDFWNSPPRNFSERYYCFWGAAAPGPLSATTAAGRTSGCPRRPKQALDDCAFLSVLLCLHENSLEAICKINLAADEICCMPTCLVDSYRRGHTSYYI